MLSHVGYAPASRPSSAALHPFTRLLVGIGAALLAGFCLGGLGANHAAAQIGAGRPLRRAITWPSATSTTAIISAP